MFPARLVYQCDCPDSTASLAEPLLHLFTLKPGVHLKAQQERAWPRQQRTCRFALQQVPLDLPKKIAKLSSEESANRRLLLHLQGICIISVDIGLSETESGKP